MAGLIKQTHTARRLVSVTSTNVARAEGGAASPTALALEAADAFLTGHYHVASRAQYHVHEAEELRKRLSERLPSSVLAARSRRPGRHS